MERGGGSLDDFPRKVSEAVSRDLQEDDLVLLQELPRAPPGWQQEVLGKWKMVGCRSDEQWRGTGIMFQPARWNVMRRLQAPKGTWYRLRHAQDGTEIWAGTVYLRPDLSQDEHAVALQDFLKKLPATQLPVIVSGDSNSEIAWGSGDEGAAVAFGRNGKTLGLLHSLESRGLHVRPPSQDQWTTLQHIPGRRAEQANRLTSWHVPELTRGPSRLCVVAMRSSVRTMTFWHCGFTSEGTEELCELIRGPASLCNPWDLSLPWIKKH